jgi:hypothetical protein
MLQALIRPNYPRHSMLPIPVQPPISTIPCKVVYSLANPMLLFPMFLTLSPEDSASSPRRRSRASLARATERSRRDNFSSLSPFLAIRTRPLQLAENPAALSPFAATLTSSVKHNSFVCHSYRKHRGWGYILPSEFFSFRNRTTRHSLLVYPEASRRATISSIVFRIRTYRKSRGGASFQPRRSR